MDELLKVADELRDTHWEQKFFHALVHSRVDVIAHEPQQGPDGWPYLMVETSDAATEPAGKVIEWLVERGIGMVVNPRKSYPDYVFSYGMLWNFKETGMFETSTPVAPTGLVELREGQSLLAGAPDPKYLPAYVRGVLRDFFRDQGLLNVKILVLSENKIHFDLAFSLESLGNPPVAEHQGIAEALSWFLPTHYSLLLISEKGLPEFGSL